MKEKKKTNNYNTETRLRVKFMWLLKSTEKS